MLDQEAEMLRQVMELSLKEQETFKEKQRQEEMHMKLMMEKSQVEAENQEILRKKDEEL